MEAVSIRVKGSFHKMEKFLNRMEKGEHFEVLDSIAQRGWTLSQLPPLEILGIQPLCGVIKFAKNLA